MSDTLLYFVRHVGVIICQTQSYTKVVFAVIFHTVSTLLDKVIPINRQISDIVALRLRLDARAYNNSLIKQRGRIHSNKEPTPFMNQFIISFQRRNTSNLIFYQKCPIWQPFLHDLSGYLLRIFYSTISPN